MGNNTNENNATGNVFNIIGEFFKGTTEIIGGLGNIVAGTATMVVIIGGIVYNVTVKDHGCNLFGKYKTVTLTNPVTGKRIIVNGPKYRTKG